jgi:hypothetical protein
VVGGGGRRAARRGEIVSVGCLSFIEGAVFARWVPRNPLGGPSHTARG